MFLRHPRQIGRHCIHCDLPPTHFVPPLRRYVCDKHAKFYTVVEELRDVQKPVPQADRAY